MFSSRPTASTSTARRDGFIPFRRTPPRRARVVLSPTPRPLQALNIEISVLRYYRSSWHGGGLCVRMKLGVVKDVVHVGNHRPVTEITVAYSSSYLTLATSVLSSIHPFHNSRVSLHNSLCRFQLHTASIDIVT